MTDGSPQPPLTHADAIRALHVHYCEHTGNALSLTIPRMDAWSQWMAHGWTAADLKLVLAYIKRRCVSPGS